MSAASLLADDIPGHELVCDGLRDLEARRVTPAACLPSIAQPWLERAGVISAADGLQFVAEPEHALCRLLCDEHGDPYSRYNSFCGGSSVSSTS